MHNVLLGVVLMMCDLGKLEKRELDEVASLETELGKTLLAFRCYAEVNPAELTEAELNRILEVEDKLKLSLVAVKY
jgi:hypothetical protein